jgi:nitrate/nitrite transporter NarK
VIILIMTGAKTAGSAYALAAAAGLIFAPAFPATVGVTFEKMGGGSGSIFGIIFAVGLAGAVFVPKAIGNMAKGASVQKALKLLLPVCAILLVLALILHSRPAKAVAVEAADVVAEEAVLEAEAVAEVMVEPAVEEPAVEEPAIEEPVIEEPVMEEPAAEEPAVL